MIEYKYIIDIEHFIDLFDEFKQSRMNIIINNIKIDKRKNIIEDMNDVFDNNIIVSYYYDNKNVYIKFN